MDRVLWCHYCCWLLIPCIHLHWSRHIIYQAQIKGISLFQTYIRIILKSELQTICCQGHGSVPEIQLFRLPCGSFSEELFQLYRMLPAKNTNSRLVLSIRLPKAIDHSKSYVKLDNIGILQPPKTFVALMLKIPKLQTQSSYTEVYIEKTNIREAKGIYEFLLHT